MQFVINEKPVDVEFDTRTSLLDLLRDHLNPQIDIIWANIPDPHTPMGARGIDEIGITGTGAAVANAIFNACGKRIRELPITLDKLF
jgi:CO/xanthine dehydrogenase Mo-binding subunit